MTSIYQRALGDDFDRLHPKVRERFGFSSADGVAHIGTGVMDEITRGTAITVPFLTFGTTRNLLFPEHGTGIPFTVANYAYADRFGRETVTWHRTFDFPTRQCCFDATMIYSEQRDSIVDYLGTHQHVAADLNCWVDDEGGMNFTSGDQRCYEGPLRFRFPRPFTGHATVREWWTEDPSPIEPSPLPAPKRFPQLRYRSDNRNANETRPRGAFVSGVYSPPPDSAAVEAAWSWTFRTGSRISQPARTRHAS